MAAVEATVVFSRLEGISDSTRARELYKYFQPNAPINADTYFPGLPATSSAPPEEDELSRDINIKSNVTSSKISSPDAAMTAFCQLVVWRTGTQRAMISVIDAETQYVIAESTKTVDLLDNTKHEPGDDIWMGCSSVSKAGRPCERTIEVRPMNSGDYPSFIVNDLSKDERFNTLPSVTGPPFLKFYAGVPLITKRGIPIGSLFVGDDQAGHSLGRDKIHFMGTMAGIIIKHMEIVREVEEHRRGTKMSRGLASFVEGRAQLAEADMNAEDVEGTKFAGPFAIGSSIDRTKSKGSTPDYVTSAIGPLANIERNERQYSAALSKTEESTLESHGLAGQSESPDSRPDLESVSQLTSFGGTSISTSSPHNTHDRSPPEDGTSERSSMRLLFSRAANLIRESFEVDGGAVFYDAQIGFRSSMNEKSELGHTILTEDRQMRSLADSSHTRGDDPVSSSEQHSDGDVKVSPPALAPQSAWPELREATFSRAAGESVKTVEVLGFSTEEASSIHNDPLPGPQAFTPFEQKALHTLLRLYPRGKLWTFDSDEAVSSSSDGETFSGSPRDLFQRSKGIRQRKLGSQKTKSDAKIFAKHFPGVRQLLFVPLWDAGLSRWLSACFAWSTEPTRILSKQSELAFLTAFGNSIVAEWSRLDTEIADQKKSDFIGSISHELRSPLHGILASAEFLEEVTTGWESTLVATIDSCGRTLLDTINHILDYSKISHFEENWRKTKHSDGLPTERCRDGSLSLLQPDLPMLNLFQDVDISVICEEVVESVFAGHVFQSITARSFDMVPDARGKMSDRRDFVSASDQPMGPRQVQHADVAVILDMNLQNYHFTTQPGAVRRLIMNLLGNALKYTSHGYVRIKLDVTDLPTSKTSGCGKVIPRSSVVLTVTDTGRGISAGFLRSKLFMPFAQENSLSSGTGLGLSIVRKIVSLLEGEIAIDSEVGRGTQFQVTLPLLREMPRTAISSTSTPRFVISVPRETDESIIRLRTRVEGQKVSLHGFDIDTKDPIIREMGQLLQASITTFLVNWYGLRVVSLVQKPNIIISNEASPDTISKLVQQSTTVHESMPSIIVLLSHSSRFDRVLSSNFQCNIGYVTKPIGPLKLAKAITQCLKGDSKTATRGSGGPPTQVESSDLSDIFEELSLGPRGGEVFDNTRMAADSDNARKAIETPTPNAAMEKHREFPFPHAEDASVPNFQTMPADKAALKQLAPGQSTLLASTSVQKALPTGNEAKLKSKPPTLLLVDDNQINLRLLSTYINRRNYEIVDEAQNGLEAVHRVEARQEGYDIIFIDITMPILDGFGATRQIRAIEEKRKKSAMESVGLGGDLGVDGAGNSSEALSMAQSHTEKAGSRNPALIIAFTGRSSIEDQTEAVRVGIDLFMTKPVALKEVGKIIDNWSANRESEATGINGNVGRS